MYEHKLSATVDPDLMENCKGIIDDLMEKRHRQVFEWQRLISERLKLKNTVKQQSGHSGKNYRKSGQSNQVQTPSMPNKCWVVNLIKTPLSDTQESLLAHGPNFAVTPKTPLIRKL